MTTSVMLFWDYDTQWGGDRSRSGRGVRHYGFQEFENIERILDLHAEYQIPACFAVVGAAALPGARPYHDPDQIRKIHAAGHEIGSHSMRHEWLPGLHGNALKETLVSSKQALEDCIGAPVTTFVPPFNQPFDYPRALSISYSERREAGRDRTGLSTLCDTLAEAGYRFCRVAYRPLPWRALEAIAGRRIDRPSSLHQVRGVVCAKLNTPCGFAAPTRGLIARHLNQGGLWVVYAHPHSASESGTQSFAHLASFLAELRMWRQQGNVRFVLPREVTRSTVPIPVWT